MNIVNSYNNIDSKSWEIGEAFLKGILFEVTSYPKPGLVSSISSGAHNDMNIVTFMSSSAAIAPVFYMCAQAGREHNGEYSRLLPILREIGVWGENKLLKSTKGINTQRGILFSAGILCGAAGFLSKNAGKCIPEELFDISSKITKGIVDRELTCINQSKTKLTAGEQLYLKYGVTGIRGEVEAGFPSVINIGLPALKYSLRKGLKLNHCLIHTLISLMTCVNDTTILWRKNKNVLTAVQEQAKNILSKGSVFTEEGLNAIKEIDSDFTAKNISPGGSADLVAVTVGSYLLENNQFPVEIM